MKHKSLSNSSRRNKVLLGTLIPFGLLSMGGGGIGVGYAVWHKKTPNPPPQSTFAYTVYQTAPTIPIADNNVNNKINKIEIVSKNPVASTYVNLQVDPFYTQYFETNSNLSISPSIYHHADNGWGCAFSNDRAAFAIEVIKDLPANTPSIIIPFDLHFIDNGKEISRYTSHFIFSQSSGGLHINNVNNMVVKLSDLNDGDYDRPDVNQFCNCLTNLFGNFLPKPNDGASKISFQPSDNYETVMEQLHKYDTACSIFMLLISDLYNSIPESAWNGGDAVKAISISNTDGVSGVSPTNGTVEQKFNLAFQQIGINLGDEDHDDIFIFKNDNFSSDQWEVEWDSWLHTTTMHNISLDQWYDQGPVVGRATGMMSLDNSTKTELKAIYTNVVDAWPNGW